MNTVYIGLNENVLNFLAEKKARTVGKYVGTRGIIGEPIYFSVYAIAAKETEILFWENKPYNYHVGNVQYIFTRLSVPGGLENIGLEQWTPESIINTVKNKINGE